jgi:PAS domain S-box-containing protein
MDGELLLQILNFSNAYVLVLDKEMNIRYINHTLTNRIGFETYTEILGTCWLNFIPEKSQDEIKMVHASIVRDNESTEYKEFTNHIQDVNGVKFKVKWFNMCINHGTFWTFSFGLPQVEMIAVTEDDIRSRFMDAIESDRTMIKALKDHSQTFSESFSKTCDLKE